MRERESEGSGIQSLGMSCRLVEVTCLLLLLLILCVTILKVMTLPQDRDNIIYFVQRLKEGDEVQQFCVVGIVKP